MELDVTSAFATLIGRLRVPDADAMNPGLLGVFPQTPRRDPGWLPKQHPRGRRTAANDNTAWRYA
jgi:hypothetical protein